MLGVLRVAVMESPTLMPVLYREKSQHLTRLSTFPPVASALFTKLNMGPIYVNCLETGLSNPHGSSLAGRGPWGQEISLKILF